MYLLLVTLGLYSKLRNKKLANQIEQYKKQIVENDNKNAKIR